VSDSYGCDNLETCTLAAEERRVLIAVLAINVATFLKMVAGFVLSGSSSSARP